MRYAPAVMRRPCHVRSLVWSVCAVAACGPKSSTTSVAPTTIQAAASTAAPGQLPEGPPLVTPGERMTYRLSLQGLELAVFTFGVDTVSELEGRRVVLVQSHAKSVGLANMVAAIDDRFTSWIDVATGRTVRFQTDEYETNSKTNIEHATIDIAARDGDRIPITFHLNDGPKTPEPQQASKPETWDFNSFLVALRAWEGAPGSTASIECFRSRYLWNIEVKIAAKERLVTELGELPSLRFDAVTYKLTRDGQRDPGSEQRQFSLWISDDEGRVPLQIVARTDYGDVKMQIVEYTPGDGTPLR